MTTDTSIDETTRASISIASQQIPNIIHSSPLIWSYSTTHHTMLLENEEFRNTSKTSQKWRHNSTRTAYLLLDPFLQLCLLTYMQKTSQKRKKFMRNSCHLKTRKLWLYTGGIQQEQYWTRSRGREKQTVGIGTRREDHTFPNLPLQNEKQCEEGMHHK